MEDVVPWDYHGADKLFQPVDIVAISNSCNMALTCLTHKDEAHSVLCVSWCLAVSACATRSPEYHALSCHPSMYHLSQKLAVTV